MTGIIELIHVFSTQTEINLIIMRDKPLIADNNANFFIFVLV